LQSHRRHQGDHIGRIFSPFLFTAFFNITEEALISGFLALKVMHNFGKNRLGYTLGDFFGNSFGHPGPPHFQDDQMIL
jgi:hypothetical protein